MNTKYGTYSSNQISNSNNSWNKFKSREELRNRFNTFSIKNEGLIVEENKKCSISSNWTMKDWLLSGYPFPHKNLRLRIAENESTTLNPQSIGKRLEEEVPELNITFRHPLQNREIKSNLLDTPIYCAYQLHKYLNEQAQKPGDVYRQGLESLYEGLSNPQLHDPREDKFYFRSLNESELSKYKEFLLQAGFLESLFILYENNEIEGFEKLNEFFKENLLKIKEEKRGEFKQHIYLMFKSLNLDYLANNWTGWEINASDPSYVIYEKIDDIELKKYKNFVIEQTQKINDELTIQKTTSQKNDNILYILVGILIAIHFISPILMYYSETSGHLKQD